MRRIFVGLFVLFVLAACGGSKPIAEQIPGQWTGGPSNSLLTFTTDGWVYEDGGDDLTCWSLTDAGITLHEPGETVAADETRAQVTIEGDTMNWTNEGRTLSFKRTSDTNVLPPAAKTILVERALSDDPAEAAKTKCK